MERYPFAFCPVPLQSVTAGEPSPAVSASLFVVADHLDVYDAALSSLRGERAIVRGRKRFLLPALASAAPGAAGNRLAGLGVGFRPDLGPLCVLSEAREDREHCGVRAGALEGLASGTGGRLPGLLGAALPAAALPAVLHGVVPAEVPVARGFLSGPAGEDPPAAVALLVVGDLEVGDLADSERGPGPGPSGRPGAGGAGGGVPVDGDQLAGVEGLFEHLPEGFGHRVCGHVTSFLFRQIRVLVQLLGTLQLPSVLSLTLP